MAHCLKLHLRAFCRLIFCANKPHAIGPPSPIHTPRTYCPLWRVIYLLFFACAISFTLTNICFMSCDVISFIFFALLLLFFPYPLQSAVNSMAMNFEHFLLAICVTRSRRRAIMVLYINQFVFGNWQLQRATCNLQLFSDTTLFLLLLLLFVIVAAHFCAFHLSFISILSVNFLLLLPLYWLGVVSCLVCCFLHIFCCCCYFMP